MPVDLELEKDVKRENRGEERKLFRMVKACFKDDVHSNSEDHRHVSNEAEQGIVDGVVKEQVVCEFVASKIERMVDSRSHDVSNDRNEPIRLISHQPSNSELSQHREDHPVASPRVRSKKVLDLRMLGQDLLSTRTMRFLSVGPRVIA